MELKRNGTGVIISRDSAGLSTPGVYKFKYKFVKKNLVKFYTSTTVSYHQISLNGQQLNLRPYPWSAVYNESVEVIDAVDFHR